MRTFLCTILAALLLACGGSHKSSPPPPPPAAPTPIPAGTYQARPRQQAAQPGVVEAQPIGDIAPTMIVQNDGSGRLELAGWQHVRAVIYADPQGQLQISPDATLTHPDGTTEPLTLTGTLTNGRLVGTSNGGAFDLELTTIQDQPQDLTAKVGSYLSTASSNGRWIRLVVTMTASGNGANLAGEAYATREDALARVNVLNLYTGSLGYSDGDAAHIRNCFNIGYQMITFNPDGSRNYLPGGTYGLAYFAPDGGLVALTANHTNSNLGSGQLSATFAKE
jgi:hypothetical protein